MQSNGTQDAAMIQAINNAAVQEKKQHEQKKFNEFVYASQLASSYAQLEILIKQYLKRRAENLASQQQTDKALYAEEKEKFLEHLEKYYQQVNQTPPDELKEKSEQEQIKAALDVSIQAIRKQRAMIEQGWKIADGRELWQTKKVQNGKEIWVNKTWDEGVKAQADYFASSNGIKLAVDKSVTELLGGQKDLSKDQLAEAQTKALDIFKQELSRAQENKVEDPASSVILQVKYSSIIYNAVTEMNQVIDHLNETRKAAGQPEIDKIKLSVQQRAKFANEGVAPQEAEQIMQNMRNFVLLQNLSQQERALLQAQANLNNRSDKIPYCEIQSTGNRVQYDPDAGTKYAMYPADNSSLNVMSQVCHELNRQNPHQKITVTKDSDSRYLKFECGNESFKYDTRTDKLSAENVSQQTVRVMSEVMQKSYRSDSMQVACYDPLSQNLCKQALGANANTTVVLSTPGERVAQAAEKKPEAGASISPSTSPRSR